MEKIPSNYGLPVANTIVVMEKIPSNYGFNKRSTKSQYTKVND